MMTRTRRRSAGFTLIEMLVTIAIIAILVALILPALSGSQKAALRLKNGARMHDIDKAITACKSELKLRYIPSWPAGFRLRTTYAGNEPEAVILKQAFPNLNLASTGLPNVVLDSNQTLLFFLNGGAVTNGTGFSTDPVQPFKLGGSRKGPFLELNTEYILTAPNGHPWIIDVYGTPYAYFAATDGKAGMYTGQTFLIPTGTGLFKFEPCPSGAVNPVLTGGKYKNESSTQIISAGYDQRFGVGGPLPTVDWGVDDEGQFQADVLGTK